MRFVPRGDDGRGEELPGLALEEGDETVYLLILLLKEGYVTLTHLVHLIVHIAITIDDYRIGMTSVKNTQGLTGDIRDSFKKSGFNIGDIQRCVKPRLTPS